MMHDFVDIVYTILILFHFQQIKAIQITQLILQPLHVVCSKHSAFIHNSLNVW
jgi:hypothetical protein